MLRDDVDTAEEKDSELKALEALINAQGVGVDRSKGVRRLYRLMVHEISAQGLAKSGNQRVRHHEVPLFYN